MTGDAAAEPASDPGLASTGPVGAAGLLGAIYADEDDLTADLEGFLPPGVRLLTEHYPVLPPDDEVTWLRRMAAHPGIEAAAERLAERGPGAIVFAVNSFSVIDGPTGAAAISGRISSSGGAPAVTTSEAMVEAVRALGVRRLAVGVPYGPPVTEIMTGYFAAYGVEVVKMHGLDLPNANNWEALLLPDDVVVEMAVAADAPGADAVYLGCTSLRTAHLVTRMEERLGKPVVTANAATIWRGLGLAGYPARRAGLGRLFDLAAR